MIRKHDKHMLPLREAFFRINNKVNKFLIEGNPGGYIGFHSKELYSQLKLTAVTELGLQKLQETRVTVPLSSNLLLQL